MPSFDFDKVLNIIIEFATTFALKLLAGLVILLIGFKIAKILINVFAKSKWYKKIDISAQSFLRSLLSIGLKSIVIVISASIMGVPMTSVVALIASAGLAIGLALQGALGNLAGGVIILIFRPFSVGDYVETSTGSGSVKEINIFYTILKTFDGRIVTMPNGNLTNAAITNYSIEEKRRVDFNFSVAYEADIDIVKSILINTAKEHELVLNDPEPTARLNKQNDSSLDFFLRAWCFAPDYWTIFHDINEAIKKEFDKQQIEIPYQQMDIHMR